MTSNGFFSGILISGQQPIKYLVLVSLSAGIWQVNETETILAESQSRASGFSKYQYLYQISVRKTNWNSKYVY